MGLYFWFCFVWGFIVFPPQIHAFNKRYQFSNNQKNTYITKVKKVKVTIVRWSSSKNCLIKHARVWAKEKPPFCSFLHPYTDTSSYLPSHPANFINPSREGSILAPGLTSSSVNSRKCEKANSCPTWPMVMKVQCSVLPGREGCGCWPAKEGWARSSHHSVSALRPQTAKPQQVWNDTQEDLAVPNTWQIQLTGPHGSRRSLETKSIGLFTWPMVLVER